MNRISKAFEKNKAFIAFVTGGDPDLDTTEALIPQMAQAGADLIEIGIPFSDPIAEGVVIQAADERALKAGTTTDKLFDMVRRVSKKTEVPLVFMTYITLHRVPALSGILLRDGIYLPGGRQAGLVGAGYVHYVLT